MNSDLDNAISGINRLTDIWKQTEDKEEFIRQINYLASLVKEDDIYTEIEKLKAIVTFEGLGKSFQTQLNNIIDFLNTKQEQYVPINDIFKEEYNSKKFDKGLSFLVPELDKLTGGIQSGTICTIAGGPGSMKTTYAVNICYNAIRQGMNVCYLSLEETPLQLYSKLLSRASVDCTPLLMTSEITQGKLSDIDKEVLLEKVYPYLESQEGIFYILGEKDFYNYEQSEIESKLKEIDNLMKEKSKSKQADEEHGIDILVIDHIQLLKYASSTKDEYRLINEYVSFFRRQSLSFLRTKKEIVVILLSQVNREGIAYAGNKNHYGEYLMQHVAEASEVERASSYIVSVYTDALVQITKQLKVGALKLRGSAIPNSTMTVYAEGRYYQVGDISVPEQMDYSADIVLNTNSKPPIYVAIESEQLEVDNTSTLSDLNELGF